MAVSVVDASAAGSETSIVAASASALPAVSIILEWRASARRSLDAVGGTSLCADVQSTNPRTDDF